ncbi:MAG TPA: low temperature requirement protein A [Thermoleophilaceae bacterium]|nr:low temperature requirement protein A [Thermoleophilaceae bacterium]
MPERRSSPVELLWDLVFVFAVTQVSSLLARDMSWLGLGHAMIVLALMWWAWSAFVWVANAEPEDSLVLRGVLLTAMAFIFVTGLALPHAFGSQATLFSVTYVLVRFLHLGFYAYVSRRGNAAWSALVGFMLSTTVGMAMLVAGSFLDEGPRAIVWTAALALDYAGPAWFTRERLRGLQEVAVAHFAERYGLFVIICLGESIVAIGLSADRESLDAEVLTAVALGLLATIGLWWTYFERVAGTAEAHLRTHRDPVLAAADGYSYIHLVIVAGIIVFAVGMKVTIHQLGEPLSEAARLATCGGVAAYLVGDAAFRLRLAGELDVAKLVAAAALLVLFAVGGGLSALWLTAAATLVLAALCTLETVSTAHELEKEEA